jgi:hypothetical protein
MSFRRIEWAESWTLDVKVHSRQVRVSRDSPWLAMNLHADIVNFDIFNKLGKSFMRSPGSKFEIVMS